MYGRLFLKNIAFVCIKAGLYSKNRLMANEIWFISFLCLIDEIMSLDSIK